MNNFEYAMKQEEDMELKEALEGFQCVYCIQCTKTGDVKIGYTRDIQSRLETLQIGSPTKLRCIHKLYTEDAIGLEKALHHHWNQYRTHGEWFRIPEEILYEWITQ